MPDILACLADDQHLLHFENVLDKQAVRAKITLTPEDCLQWAEQRSFQILVVDAEIEEADVQRLAQAVWNNNSLCRVIVLTSRVDVTYGAVLFGCEVIPIERIEDELVRSIEVLQEAEKNFVHSEHVLVVEDLDAPRDIICLFLEGLGVGKVSSVSSADQALERLAENPNAYTTILTDIRMPKMSGAELIHTIRKTSGIARIPVIVLTAHGTRDCLVDCLRAGASGFLVKPPKKEDLLRELERAERMRRSGASVRLIAPENVDAFLDQL